VRVRDGPCLRVSVTELAIPAVTAHLSLSVDPPARTRQYSAASELAHVEPPRKNRRVLRDDDRV
jgi:hypothetical protein